MKKVLKNSLMKGAALIEFALSLPILILFLAGILDVGSLFFQIQLASDAARFAGRKMTFLSYANPSMLCGDIQTQATATVNSYMTETLKINQQEWELVGGGATVCKIQTGDMTNKRTLVEFRIQLKDQKTCLFCYGGLFNKIRPMARMTYLLPNNCSTTVGGGEPTTCTLITPT